jgi:SAM-dependent methyltransferase
MHAQNDVNTRFYSRAGIEQRYQRTSLMPAEGVAFLKYQPEFVHRDILDIGAGTGRTTIYLAPLAHSYQAIDYSPVMVQKFTQNFPGIPVSQADMRDLGVFPNASFDFVLASNCVFDAVDHTDRLHTLAEIYRVLRPGGTIMFSTHNRRYRHASRGPKLAYSRNPITQLMNVLEWGHGALNRARLRKLQTFSETHAIINAGGHNYALLHYYIDPEYQRRQLADAGFDLIEALDEFGVPLDTGGNVEGSEWCMYLARRSTAH